MPKNCKDCKFNKSCFSYYGSAICMKMLGETK
jgi:hypothetical protein